MQQRRQAVAPAAAALACLLLAAQLAGPATAASQRASMSTPSPSPDETLTLEFPATRNANNQPVMTVTKAKIEGRDVYYEVPQEPRGMYVFFHGCMHNGFDSWPQQEGCPECRGLPAEVAHTKQALSAGYVFMAMNSLNRKDSGQETDKCFSYADDKDSAVAAIRSLRKQLNMEGYPLYLTGVSSGAAFAGKLPKEMPVPEVDGITCEVLAVDPDQDSYDFAKWPPMAFISMLRDNGTNDRIARNVEALQEAGIPGQVILVLPRVVYWPTFFSDQAADISPELSEKIVLALVDIGVIDDQGELTDDPRHGFPNLDWRAELVKRVPELDGSSTADSVGADSSAVNELLNIAWANHEIDGEYVWATLKWFEGGGKEDLNRLAEEYIIRQPSQLTGKRLQPGQKPETSGDPPVTPWISPPAAAPAMASPPMAGVVQSPPAGNNTIVPPLKMPPGSTERRLPF